MSGNTTRIAQRLASIASALRAGASPSREEPERRQEQPARRTVYVPARIFLEDFRSVNCVIVDISENGARILIGGDVSLPQSLKLKTLHDGRFRRARLVWQRNRDAGISFAMEKRINFGNLPQAH